MEWAEVRAAGLSGGVTVTLRFLSFLSLTAPFSKLLISSCLHEVLLEFVGWIGGDFLLIARIRFRSNLQKWLERRFVSALP